MRSEKFSVKSRLGSFKFAFRGIGALLKNEHNSRIHLVAATLAIASGFLLNIDPSEWALIIIVIVLVFLSELLNSAIEKLADTIDPERNDKIMKAKDYAAAAVLISAIAAVIVGGIIFIPKILNLF